MSKERPELTPDDHTDDTIDQPVGRLRLLPSVGFGLRAAALTRVALPVAVLGASLVTGSPIGDAADATIMDTTCCPPDMN